MSVICKECGLIFSLQRNLNRHIRNVHKKVPTSFSYDHHVCHYKCLESQCSRSFKKNKELIAHLEQMHSLKFESEDLTMKNITEFAQWKASIEKENNCNFLFRTKANSAKGEIHYFYCNRQQTGTKERDASGSYKRALKSQGYSKLRYNCTSQIILRIENSSVNIEYLKTHYGHNCELQHIRLSKEDKLNIASKLINGVTASKIIDTVRDNIGEHLKRLDLLTTKDICNIRASYNVEVNDGRRNANDVLSVDLWVQECQQKSEENPVLFYKKQGVKVENFEEQYFCLIIMSTFQRLMFKKFGHNIVAIDGTHGLNGYDFELTTIMVIDEYHQGFPVAFMFCNRKDLPTYTLFFRAIKSKIGNVKPKTFMSDLDESFLKAWVDVMGSVDHSIFCAWHVDRAWQGNLNKIANKEKRSEVYKVLKILQQETDESQFELSLENAITFMMSDKETENFGLYFRNYYSRNCEKWAYCYRKSCGINTNMFLESMHKTIKYFYLDRKTVKRLDKGLHAVMKYLRDKSVERIIKITKGKSSVHTRQIFQRHQTALTSKYTIASISDNYFHLKKESGEGYFVQKVVNYFCCADKCLNCEICVHMYTCTCSDFQKESTICKHIHYLVINQNKSSSTEVVSFSEKQSTAIGNPSENQNEFISEILCSKKSHHSNNVSDHLQMVCNKIQQTDLQKLDDCIIDQICQNLTIVNNLLSMPSASKSQVIPTKTPASVRKNIVPQKRFTSTKRKRANKQNPLGRPTLQEATTIKESLLGVPQLYVSSSSSHDHGYI